MSKRESYVEKSIALLVQTAQYENLRVECKIGETISWESAKERRQKIDAIREDLKKQVAKDINDVINSFQLKTQSNIQIKTPHKEDIDLEGLEDIEEDEDFNL